MRTGGEDTVRPSGSPAAATAPAAPRERFGLAAAGVLLVLVAMVPPVSTLAHRYLMVETIQFAVFALVGPALIVLGAPWRRLRASRAAETAPGGGQAGAGALADRIAAGRMGHPHFRRAGVFLVAFMAVALAWRAPVLMDALVTQPFLIVVEMVTLLAAGIGLWLELVPSAPFTPRLPRPQRAAVAALAMWFIWIVVYAFGLNNHGVFSAYGSITGRALSLMADQEITIVIMWTAAGLSFIPVIVFAMLNWLSDPMNTDEELQRLVRDEHQRPMVRGWGHPAKSQRARS